ncbi:hypothetical protein ACM75W_29090 [Pseudomonas aeruginosa]
MTESKICTCPSGDGSLRWPCPKHPAVEQAGGDERVIGWRERILAAHPNSDPGFWPDALLVEHMAAEIADLRAALAQPSQAQAEQAEGAHVPDEVFAGVFAEWWEEEGQYCRAGGGDYERTFAFQAWRHLYPLLLQARAALAQPSPATELERPEVAEVAFVLRNIGAMDAEDIDGDNVDLRFEDAEGRDTGCDVSIVEYAEKAADLFEQHDRIVGELRAKAVQLREALEWRAENQAGQRELLRSVKAQRDAALARVAELEACGAPALLAAADYFAERAKGPSPGWVTLSAVAKELRVRTDKAPVAQAQHSVPEGWRIERSAERIVLMNLNNGAGYAAARDGESGIAESVLYLLAADLLAALPGKEGV